MEPTPLLPVIDDVARWSVWNEPRRLWFNGHHLRVGEQIVVVDPVPMTDDVAAAMARLGAPTLCVITNRDHVRGAAEIRARFGARILSPRLDGPLRDLEVDGTLDDGDLVADDLVVVAIADAKSPGELALHWRGRAVLILGDAAIGRPAGALSMLPDDKFADPAAARAAVARLAGLAPEVVLVGDGDDLLAAATAALAALTPGVARAPTPPPGAAGC